MLFDNQSDCARGTVETQRTVSQDLRRSFGGRAHRIVVVHSPDAQARRQIAVLGSAAVPIGRCGHVDGPLGIADPRLSRRHAVVEPRADRWHLRDLGSHNGTRIGGCLVTDHALAHGDVIRLGDTLLVYEVHTLTPGEPLEPESPPLYGPGLAMQRVRAELGLVAAHDVPVLVRGESGVGKELAAAVLHERSGRRGRLVPVNCAALPAELVESELFGHVHGAFTGAATARRGLFEEAEGGTLFLDEIGDMSLPLQPVRDHWTDDRGPGQTSLSHRRTEEILE